MDDGCWVCGKPWTATGFWGGEYPADHSGCQQSCTRWQELTKQIYREDKAIDAANQAIADAETERDRIYRERMAAAGIPEQIANTAVSGLYDGDY